ncbi:hypothetical protein FOZ60_014430 [Perkinsus olseni]|uniref:Uncharacterized protein n=1 Tax=Perkinsus olseni TaxID=32597 RepID=A0A7J6P718_PEROL|nr:hypothetical protein FOZ60_014430 [Perkinsus olseni]
MQTPTRHEVAPSGANKFLRETELSLLQPEQLQKGRLGCAMTAHRGQVTNSEPTVIERGSCKSQSVGMWSKMLPKKN